MSCARRSFQFQEDCETCWGLGFRVPVSGFTGDFMVTMPRFVVYVVGCGFAVCGVRLRLGLQSYGLPGLRL